MQLSSCHVNSYSHTTSHVFYVVRGNPALHFIFEAKHGGKYLHWPLYLSCKSERWSLRIFHLTAFSYELYFPPCVFCLSLEGRSF